jgi:SAM-dependent methyltransferase
VFSAIIDNYRDKSRDNTNLNVFDFGCGTGKFFTACYPYISKNGHYIGTDINEKDINFCKSYYPPEFSKFIKSDSQNDLYFPNGNKKDRFDVGNEEIDIAHALSVFTHLNEGDALHYMSEISRILRVNGIAILTFFLLDRHYDENILKDTRWVFDRKLEGSEDWLYPNWAEDVPERQIGITDDGINKLLKETNLRIVKKFTGHWKGVPGVFSQDILVLMKT